MNGGASSSPKEERFLPSKRGGAGQKQLQRASYCHGPAVGLCFLMCEMRKSAELTSEIIQLSVLFLFVLVLILFSSAKFCSSAVGVSGKRPDREQPQSRKSHGGELYVDLERLRKSCV